MGEFSRYAEDALGKWFPLRKQLPLMGPGHFLGNPRTVISKFGFLVWLEMAGKGLELLEMAEMAGINGMDGNGQSGCLK